MLAELLKQAGVPDGVFNVVQGDKVAVDRLLEHPDVKAISFVGSTPVARSIYETATRNGKRVQALGGAKNHMLVLPDADVAMAADAAVSAAYGSAGERCMAISVVVAVGSVADPLIAAIRERMAKIKVGPGFDDAAKTRQRNGPADHARTSRPRCILRHQRGFRRSHRRRRRPPARRGFRSRRLLPGSVAAGSAFNPACAAIDDEIFGPVLSVVRVNTYDEALRIINENPYGNGAAIFTRDGGAARQFQFDVEAGMVGINVPIPVPVAYYSFGGWKASLFGDLHMYGPEGVQFYTRTKVVTSRWPDPGASKVDLGFPQVR